MQRKRPARMCWGEGGGKQGQKLLLVLPSPGQGRAEGPRGLQTRLEAEGVSSTDGAWRVCKLL